MTFKSMLNLLCFCCFATGFLTGMTVIVWAIKLWPK